MAEALVPPGSEPNRYRVFVSYSHDDTVLARVIVKYLEEECGLKVIWDQTFAYGEGFHDQIRDCISHAHVFLPVLTHEATERGWVQQEIGFAMAMNIPVLPITVDALPGQMISVVHAVKLEPLDEAAGEELHRILEDLDADLTGSQDASKPLRGTKLWHRLTRELSRDKLERLIKRHSDTSLARYQCADYQEERTMLMVRHANAAYDLHHKGLFVRQLGGLSSFHIPTEEPSNEIWKCRYGPVQRSEFHKKWQRAEHEALAQHAYEAGCALVVNPYDRYGECGPRAYAVRLLCLLQFLRKWDTARPLTIAITDKLGFHESITIVGDVFAAMAIAGSSSGGYMQTVFTTHAPSMHSRQLHFDRRLAECLPAGWSWKRDKSRKAACAEIERILNEYLDVTVKAGVSPVKLVKDLPEKYEGKYEKIQPQPPIRQEVPMNQSSPADNGRKPQRLRQRR